MKHKKRKRYPYYGSVFAPLFRLHSTTPRTTPDATSPGTVTPSATGGASPMGDSVKPSKRRVVHEMRMSLREGGSAPIWTGFGVPNAAMTLMKQSTPMVAGPGFQPVEPGQGGRYDFGTSPGLGFKTAAAWRVWQAALEILPRAPQLTIVATLQAAMQRAGVRFGEIDTAEMRLLEMGIEWYLSDPDKFKPKDSPGGLPGGVGITHANSGVV